MSDGHLEYYVDKTILVTGGAGAIGSNLTAALADAGARAVIILDNLSASYRWIVPAHPKVMFVRGDVADDVDLKRVFNEQPDLVFHLAAFFANQNSIDYPERDLETNGLGTLRLLEYARLTGVDKVRVRVVGLLHLRLGCAAPVEGRVHVDAPIDAVPDHEDAR